jgi:sugar diacid utilization regulator
MQISLNIILDVLMLYKLEIHIANRQVSFAMCLPLPDGPEELNKDCIYIGELSRALQYRSGGSSFFCICRRDRVKDSIESESHLAGLVIVNENITQVMLLTQVQTRFFSVLDWNQRMRETLHQDGSIQDLVDLGASLLDNYIAISDSSLMLMAYSKNIPCDDPICTALVEYGYHPEESIRKFKQYDLFTKWESANSIYIDDTLTTAKYVALNKIFKFSNVYFAHVVMTCHRNLPTPGLVDLFQIFLDVLAVYIEHAWEAKSACNHIYDTFLTDLIEGNLTSRSVIEERAQYVGIPLTGQFCLFQIVSNNSANMSIGKMLLDFAELFPRFKFIRYQQRIIAINHFYPRNDMEEQLQTICLSLDNFLEKYDAQCGISLFFSSLNEIPFSFQQSTLALKYAGRLLGRELCRSMRVIVAEETRIHHYRNNYLYCLFGENEGNAELWFHSEYHEKLKRLYEYDAKHKSSIVQLLHIYLSTELSATETGNLLNMHRNNVLYHINRIEEMLGLDFHDPRVRLTLLNSFVLLELYGLDLKSSD